MSPHTTRIWLMVEFWRDRSDKITWLRTDCSRDDNDDANFNARTSVKGTHRHTLQKWRFGLVIARWSRSTKLLYTPGPISTGMGDRLQPVSNQPLRPTQPSTLSGTDNEHQSKRGDAVRMGSKGRYGSFHLWINVWINLCFNTCHTWAP